jgi:hypothetical protein
MNGQWIGEYDGTNTGLLVVDVDQLGDKFEGMISAYNSSAGLPSMRGFMPAIAKGQSRASLRVLLPPVHRHNGEVIDAAALSQQFPGITCPSYADTEWEIGDEQIILKWTTNIGTSATALLLKSAAAKPTELSALTDVATWEQFKTFAATLEPYQFIFRGQENNLWRLRTSFHRTGRSNLFRFDQQDVRSLYRHLSGLTTHKFNLPDPLDYAAFLNLIQHHGYPTPFLDWTYSPFIAAYFAFKNIRPEPIPRSRFMTEKKVRVLIFAKGDWLATFQNATALNPAHQHITALEALAINNPRAIPQQSTSLVTNVDDVEKYINSLETQSGKTYLRAIDLPASDRRTVMRELSLMGINAGTLLPGLDGACEQLKERFFEL